LEVSLVDDDELFCSYFSSDELKLSFDERFSKSAAKGVDRLSGPQFVGRAGKEFAAVSVKCINGKYRFSPYLESLRLKGRGKYPRVISIPAVRDRVVLNQLNRFLSEKFPQCVTRNVASAYVRSIAADFKDISSASWVCSCDIKTFYDSIDRSRLLSILARNISSKVALSLICHAIYTPTVPQGTSKNRHSEYKMECGVPQGLAISNILAAIYMADIDERMRSLPINYYRYVDDVIMYGSAAAVKTGLRSLRALLAHRKLSMHSFSSGKGHVGPIVNEFNYLGYSFRWPIITVRSSTRERFLQSIAAKFSDYMHNKYRRLERYNYLTSDRLFEIFMLELNERITGAVSENRRYGWVAYFSQITELSILHQLDHSIRGMFSRLGEYTGSAPEALKKLSRAHFEIRHNRAEKLSFLIERGRCGPNEAMTDVEISERYDNYRKKVLSEMHADEGVLY
jgi:RNA-directed DNA polymerase